MTRAKISRAVAFHEAAHAVARLAVGATATPVEARWDGTGLSHGTGLAWQSAGRGQHAAWDLLAVLLAGGLAEARASRKAASTVFFQGASDDYAAAEPAIAWLVKSGFADDTAAAWDRAFRGARALVLERWTSIERVAGLLQTQGHLDAALILQIAAP